MLSVSREPSPGIFLRVITSVTFAWGVCVGSYGISGMQPHPLVRHECADDISRDLACRSVVKKCCYIVTAQQSMEYQQPAGKTGGIWEPIKRSNQNKRQPTPAPQEVHGPAGRDYNQEVSIDSVAFDSENTALNSANFDAVLQEGPKKPRSFRTRADGAGKPRFFGGKFYPALSRAARHLSDLVFYKIRKLKAENQDPAKSSPGTFEELHEFKHSGRRGNHRNFLAPEPAFSSPWSFLPKAYPANLCLTDATNDEDDDLLEPKTPHPKYRRKESKRFNIPDPGVFIKAADESGNSPPLIGCGILQSKTAGSGEMAVKQNDTHSSNESAGQFADFDLQLMPKRFIDGQPAFSPVNINYHIPYDADALDQAKFWLIQESNAEARRTKAEGRTKSTKWRKKKKKTPVNMHFHPGRPTPPKQREGIPNVQSIPVLILKSEDLRSPGALKNSRYNVNKAKSHQKVPELPRHKEPESSYNCKGSSPYYRHKTLFKSETDGYSAYRIPTIVKGSNGVLVVFCEARRHNLDDHGQIDLVFRRSLDHGRTWEPAKVLINGKGHAVSNPAPVADSKSGTIILIFCRSPAKVRETAIRIGMAQPRSVWLTKSNDGGESWSYPVEITDSVRRKNWSWYATGPAHGIQLTSGRLVIPCNHVVGTDGSGGWKDRSHIIYSDNGGRTWGIGGTSDFGTNEAAVAQLGNGSLYLNSRNMQNKKRRYGIISNNNGMSFNWGRYEVELVEPAGNGCQGSLLVVPNEIRGGTAIVFANPYTTNRDRSNLSLAVSTDNAKSWPVGRVIYPGPSAYSDMAFSDSGLITVVYERGREGPYEEIAVDQLNLAWLMANHPTYRYNAK